MSLQGLGMPATTYEVSYKCWGYPGDGPKHAQAVEPRDNLSQTRGWAPKRRGKRGGTGFAMHPARWRGRPVGKTNTPVGYRQKHVPGPKNAFLGSARQRGARSA
eukprot:gene18290-37143_t